MSEGCIDEEWGASLAPLQIKFLGILINYYEI